MNKKIIAKEGLIFLGIVLLSGINDITGWPDDIYFFSIFIRLYGSYMVFKGILFSTHKLHIQLGKYDLSGIAVTSFCLALLLLSQLQNDSGWDGGPFNDLSAYRVLNGLSDFIVLEGILIAIGMASISYSLLYMASLIIRFVIWARKILKEK